LHLTSKILLLILVILLPAYSISQWQQDVRLTNAPGDGYTSLNSSRCLTISGNIVHAVWSDERDGNREIYYKRSPDSGISWGPDVRFTNNPLSSWRPCIASNGPVIHIVWGEEEPGNFEIYYKRSTDNGLTWSANTRLTFDSGRSWAPSMAINGNIIHVVWEESRNGNEEVYYKRSIDAGLTWGSDTRLTFDSSGTLYPSVAVSGNIVHVVWYDFRTGRRTVFYKRSTDGGVNWSTDTQLTFAFAESYNPSVGVSGQTVHVAWHDLRDGNEEIYYKRSTDGGISWEQDVRITNTYGISWYPSMAVLSESVHLAWYDNSDGNYEIYYTRSTNGGTNWQVNTRLTFDTAGSYRPSIAVSDTMVHLIWNDSRDGNFEIYYKRNPNGNPIGIPGLSSELPTEYILYQNYPNPFNPSTTIRFLLPKPGNVTLKLYNISGKEVALLISNKNMNAGIQKYQFKGSDIPSGIYFYSLTVDNKFAGTGKMALIK
jgi:hypothetical protein